MTDVRKVAWEDVQLEELNPLISRRLIYSEAQMLAHVEIGRAHV